VGGLALLPAGAGATPPPTQPPPPAYETVVRGHRVDEGPPPDDPAGFTTLLRFRELEPGVELARLLELAPGLRVRETGAGGRQSLSLRGTDSQQVSVFLDGVRLTQPAGGGVDLSLLDPAHLQAAEVRRGGGAARFGGSALGGALLLSTPRLTTREATRFGVGYGSFNSLAVNGARAASVRSFRYLVSASYRQTQGDFPYVDDNGVARVRSNNDQRNGELLLKGDRLLAGRWLLGVLDDLALAERGAPGLSQRPSATARQQDLRNVTSLRLTRLDAVVSGGKLELGLAHRYQRFRFDEPSPPEVRSHNQSFGIEGTALLGLPLHGVGRVDAGLELRGELFRDESTDNPSRLETDLWLASSLRLWREHVVLVPAVRLAAATGFGATAAPRAGLVVRPLRWTRRPALAALEVVGNVGRSYRYPSFQEMYVRVDGFGGNAALQPEDSLDGDVGLRWRGRRLSLEGAYYRRAIKNLILFAPVSSFLVRADNYRGARAEGAEAALTLAAPGGLELRASYVYTRTRFGDPPMRLPGHPAHRVKARLEWRAPLRGERWGLRLWSGAVVESAMVLGRFDSLAEEGRVLLSAGGALRYRTLTLRAEGENLLDKRDAVDAVGFPLLPARFLVSLAGAL